MGWYSFSRRQDVENGSWLHFLYMMPNTLKPSKADILKLIVQESCLVFE